MVVSSVSVLLLKFHRGISLHRSVRGCSQMLASPDATEQVESLVAGAMSPAAPLSAAAPSSVAAPSSAAAPSPAAAQSPAAAPSPAPSKAAAAAADAADAAIALGESDARAALAADKAVTSAPSAPALSPPHPQKVIPPAKRLQHLLRKIAAYEEPAPFRPTLSSSVGRHGRLPTSSWQLVRDALTGTAAEPVRPQTERIPTCTALADRLTKASAPPTPASARTGGCTSTAHAVDYNEAPSAWAALERGRVTLLSARWLCQPGSWLAPRDELPSAAFVTIDDLQRWHRMSDTSGPGGIGGDTEHGSDGGGGGGAGGGSSSAGGRPMGRPTGALPIIVVSHARPYVNGPSATVDLPSSDATGALHAALVGMLRSRLETYERPWGREDVRRGFADIGVFVSNCCLPSERESDHGRQPAPHARVAQPADAEEMRLTVAATLFAHALTTVYVIDHSTAAVDLPSLDEGGGGEGSKGEGDKAGSAAHCVRPYMHDARCVFELHLARLTKGDSGVITIADSEVDGGANAWDSSSRRTSLHPPLDDAHAYAGHVPPRALWPQIVHSGPATAPMCPPGLAAHPAAFESALNGKGRAAVPSLPPHPLALRDEAEGIALGRIYRTVAVRDTACTLARACASPPAPVHWRSPLCPWRLCTCLCPHVAPFLQHC